MERIEVESVAAIIVFAASSENGTSDDERARIKDVFEGLAGDDDARVLAAAHRRVILRQTTLEAEAACTMAGNLARRCTARACLGTPQAPLDPHAATDYPLSGHGAVGETTRRVMNGSGFIGHGFFP